jgi:hypothetical protein
MEKVGTLLHLFCLGSEKACKTMVEAHKIFREKNLNPTTKVNHTLPLLIRGPFLSPHFTARLCLAEYTMLVGQRVSRFQSFPLTILVGHDDRIGPASRTATQRKNTEKGKTVDVVRCGQQQQKARCLEDYNY